MVKGQHDAIDNERMTRTTTQQMELQENPIDTQETASIWSQRLVPIEAQKSYEVVVQDSLNAIFQKLLNLLLIQSTVSARFIL